ncbi:prepilin peptidase [Denitromonas sp.]|uniref:prepilin peptidase n=1 Tax=Denitromonas sp. TaxID=2734609 RepID=UPI003A89295B
MTDLLSDPLAFIPLATLVGLFVGSFLNVVIHRLPKMMENEWALQAAELRGEAPGTVATFNLATPRSRCPHCGTQVTAFDNIPILSYLMLRGRCRHCKAPISRRYPVVELATATLSGLAAWTFGNSIMTLGAMLFLWAMIALTFIDLDTQLLPDSITLPLLWLGLAFNLGGSFTSINDAVVGAMAGYLSLWLVFHLFRLVTGKEGMGYGDFKLLAAIGAWLGWQMLPLTILLSSVVGAAVGIALIVFARHGRNTPIPFGPYLAAAGVLALFFGDVLNARYLQLL